MGLEPLTLESLEMNQNPGQGYYSATILQMSGVEDDRLAIWLASVTAFTNFLFTLVGVWLVEKVGRRKLTFGSLAGTTIALIILALGFLLSAQVSPPITLKPVAPPGQNTTCTRYRHPRIHLDRKESLLSLLVFFQSIQKWKEVNTAAVQERYLVFAVRVCIPMNIHSYNLAKSPSHLLPPVDRCLSQAGSEVQRAGGFPTIFPIPVVEEQSPGGRTLVQCPSFPGYCDECMLDPDCGFCYKMNKSIVIDSSCVPVNKASTNEAAWGRYVTHYMP
ncbi:hypothetical protein CB1_000728010 [Camelus ferus]|nr:hypothetical protein CB1_000728010 [Camelus ferus]